MNIDETTVEKIAHLARLELENMEERVKDMNYILSFMEKLKEVDTTGVEPLIFMTEEVNVLRQDDVNEVLDRQTALSNAPLHNEEYFILPKMIDR